MNKQRLAPLGADGKHLDEELQRQDAFVPPRPSPSGGPQSTWGRGARRRGGRASGCPPRPASRGVQRARRRTCAPPARHGAPRRMDTDGGVAPSSAPPRPRLRWAAARGSARSNVRPHAHAHSHSHSHTAPSPLLVSRFICAAQAQLVSSIYKFSAGLEGLCVCACGSGRVRGRRCGGERSSLAVLMKTCGPSKRAPRPRAPLRPSPG